MELEVEVTSDVGMTLIRRAAFVWHSASLSAWPLLSLSSDKLSSPTADGLASRATRSWRNSAIY